MAKKHYLTTYQGGGPPPIMKKYKILGGNTLKFGSLVEETAFFEENRGGRFEKIHNLVILWAGINAILATNPT